jgi:hypothetical protein
MWGSLERNSRITPDEREHGHQGCLGGIGDGRLAYETNNQVAKMIGGFPTGIK